MHTEKKKALFNLSLVSKQQSYTHVTALLEVLSGMNPWLHPRRPQSTHSQLLVWLSFRLSALLFKALLLVTCMIGITRLR